MSAPSDHAPAAETESADRGYQLAGFFVGVVVALVVVIPLASVML